MKKGEEGRLIGEDEEGLNVDNGHSLQKDKKLIVSLVLILSWIFVVLGVEKYRKYNQY